MLAIIAGIVLAPCVVVSRWWPDPPGWVLLVAAGLPISLLVLLSDIGDQHHRRAEPLLLPVTQPKPSGMSTQ